MSIKTWLLLPLILSACRTMTIESSQGKEEALPDEQLSEMEILGSLSFIYYRGNPTPPSPSDEEIERAKARLGSAHGTEKKHIHRFYGDRMHLVALANRDTDGDGVKDFRVSHYYGKFYEGDLDVDGDGVRNIYDSAPFDKQQGGTDTDGDGIPDRDFTDQDGDGIPDHVDWSQTMGTDRPNRSHLVHIQNNLFKNHKIILVERDADFNEATVLSIDDTISRVFARAFAVKPVLPTLRTIAAESLALLKAEEGGSTDAMVTSFSETLTIYQSGLNASPLVKLGLLVHEIGHSFQYAMDYRSGSLEEANRTFYPQPKYFGSLQAWGWDTDPSPGSQEIDFLTFIPTYELVRPDFTYRNKSIKAWTAYATETYQQFGDEYLESAPFKDLNIVSEYSLYDPFEWESENLIAYLFSELESHAARYLTLEREQVRRQLADLVYVDWPGFFHANFIGAPFANHFKDKFPMTNEDRLILVKRYIAPIMQAGANLTAYRPNLGFRCHRQREDAQTQER